MSDESSGVPNPSVSSVQLESASSSSSSFSEPEQASVDRISFYTLATSEDMRHYIRLRGYTPWDSDVTISRY